jgi:hypothetical protein
LGLVAFLCAITPMPQTEGRQARYQAWVLKKLTHQKMAEKTLR